MTFSYHIIHMMLFKMKEVKSCVCIRILVHLSDLKVMHSICSNCFIEDNFEYFVVGRRAFIKLVRSRFFIFIRRISLKIILYYCIITFYVRSLSIQNVNSLLLLNWIINVYIMCNAIFYILLSSKVKIYVITDLIKY